MNMTHTFDENGIVLTETHEDITLPVDYSFASINDYIHHTGVTFEEIEALCLGMATHIDKLSRGEFICKKCGLRKDGISTEICNF